ncbi:MAG: CtsR family transcriptional regulator [Bacillales bacterium]|jgi:transcriptional regulator CtsR|nr:CtsR family transcriptional regulator [Bacillales bacterium]
MKNISDIIEQYLKEALLLNELQQLDLRRSEIAEQFQCVPSQVNYVINTRFTLDKGFLVESKRGGGGYIRIVKVQAHDRSDILEQVEKLVGKYISQARAEDLIIRLYEEKIITQREMKIMMSVMDRDLLSFEIEIRDELRSDILRRMIQTLKYVTE